MVRKCCSARISVGAMNATCSPFSIATIAASSATIVLPAPTSPCSRRFIGCGRCMSSTISCSACCWPPVSLNGSTRARRLADVVGDDHGARLALGVGLAAAHHQPELEEEELLEDQPALRRRAEAVQVGDRGAGRREVHVDQRLAPLDQLLARAHVRRQRVRHLRRQLRQRLVHDRALHLRRQGPRLLVDRDDAAGVQGIFVGLGAGGGFVVALLLQDLVLRVLQLQAVRGQLELPEQDDPLVGTEHVGEKRLVEEHRAQRAGGVAHEQLEDLEPRAPRRPDAAADHVADDGGGRAGTQRGDRLEAAAILVADREAIQQVFDGLQPDPLQVGGAPRADALQELQRRVERDHYCTTVAVPVPTRISRMRAGSSNGSSMLMPDGFSGERE